MNEKDFTEQDLTCMVLAIEQARLAAKDGDVPVGAVLIRPSEDGYTVLASGRNTRELQQTALGHAEINAIRDGCREASSWRLSGCTLYVTLEPCPMCAGAILAARIGRVVCGSRDPIAGAMGSVWSLHSYPMQNTTTTVEYGCREEECRALLQDFFKNRRKGKDTSI